ncbi:dihydrofolate reductase family protein [Arthrobacter roseus]|uniref:dihydrofolate reductase family protein n=1 Tax=Arthrobacter roseus TaxID=136274 RepID=UPI001965EA3F|nr:riboflavin biosynthesis pyrimidine reductase [Arthrobacter roseus]
MYPQPGGALDDAQLLAIYAYSDPSKSCARFNFVATADGAANHQGVSGGLGGPADKKVFGLLRRLADAVVVGAGTVRAEGYAGELLDAQGQQWRLGHGLATHPALVIISGSLDMASDADIFSRSPVQPIVLTTERAPLESRYRIAEVADVVVAGVDELDVEAALGELSDRGLTRLLCEGGPGVFGAFQAAGRVDELCLTFSPSLAGGGGPRIVSGSGHELQALALNHVLVSGSEVLLRYRRAV